MESLKTGISELANSDKWQKYLEFQAKFHDYSPQNTILILKQKPNASMVASYRKWLRLKRFVKAGEKAIWIRAPLLYKSNDKLELKGFKFVPVFDVSQTEGAEIPQAITKIEGDSLALKLAQLQGYVLESGFLVKYLDMGQTINGECDHRYNLIRINSSNSINQQFKTLVHELTHAKRHKASSSRQLAELEAESVAYLVCSYLGVDTSYYSFGYLLSWGNTADSSIELISKSLETIKALSSEIVSALNLHRQPIKLGEEALSGSLLNLDYPTN